MCVSLGEVLVRPLAEALSVEERPRTRERLTAILLAFGAVGRRTIERLKNSQNPAVRRTAIHLMREFGGSDALPDLTELLDDNEPQVQREAVRAILNIGTDAAYQILEQALTTGTPQSRDAIMQSIGPVRDERATPLFAYILDHVDHRGPLGAGLPARDRIARRAARSRRHRAAARCAVQGRMVGAAADRGAARTPPRAALARIGTPDAFAVLEEAAARGLARHPLGGPRAAATRRRAAAATGGEP